ncbi:unnamed protein product, partial [Prunus brigantina]
INPIINILVHANIQCQSFLGGFFRCINKDHIHNKVHERVPIND